jgi:anti-anti-sigma regulatory factor
VADPTTVDHLLSGDHVCWTFNDDDRRLTAMARFVYAGIRRRDKILYFTDSLAPTALLAGLEARRVDMARPLDTGQLRVTSVNDAHLAGGEFDPDAMLRTWVREIASARDEGWKGLRVVADMSWAVRPLSGVDRLAWYEAQINRLSADGYAIALCQYDRRLFSPEELRRFAAAHPGTAGASADEHWAPQLRITRTTDPPGLRLAGEADISNRYALATVLDSLIDDLPDSAASLTIDLSELQFADGAAAHLLLRATHPVPTKVQLSGCSPRLAKLLDLVGSIDNRGRQAAGPRQIAPPAERAA